MGSHYLWYSRSDQIMAKKPVQIVIILITDLDSAGASMTAAGSNYNTSITQWRARKQAREWIPSSSCSKAYRPRRCGLRSSILLMLLAVHAAYCTIHTLLSANIVLKMRQERQRCFQLHGASLVEICCIHLHPDEIGNQAKWRFAELWLSIQYTHCLKHSYCYTCKLTHVWVSMPPQRMLRNTRHAQLSFDFPSCWLLTLCRFWHYCK